MSSAALSYSLDVTVECSLQRKSTYEDTPETVKRERELRSENATRY
jgi:hypothetical protein